MEGRKQFTFYRSFYVALLKLPRKKRLAPLEAVITYALDRKEPENLDDMQAMALDLIRPVLDAAWDKAMAGRKGGKKTKAEFKQLSKGEEEKEEEKEKETETEEEKETEYETEDERLRACFEAFWNLYPVKVGKRNALDVWLRLTPDPKAVCDGVKKWKQTKQWREDNGRFIPRAAKFIEERHYEHLPKDHIPMGASGVLGKAELEAIARVMAEK